MTICRESCETATRDICTCTCGGASHGIGRIRWAAARAEADAGRESPSILHQVGKWKAAKKRVKGRLSTLVRKRRAKRVKLAAGSAGGKTNVPLGPILHGETIETAEYARTVVLVKWLSINHDERRQIEWLADEISKLGIATLDELAGSDDNARRRIRKRLADHFWCDCLAAIVATLEEVQATQKKIRSGAADTAGKTAALAWRKVQDSRSSSHGKLPRSRSGRAVRSKSDEQAGLDEAILERAVAGVVKLVLDGLTAGSDTGIETLVFKVRVLALIMCPNPVRHELVWKHCWLPLVKLFMKKKLVYEMHQLVDGGLDQEHTWDRAGPGREDAPDGHRTGGPLQPGV